MQARIPHLSAPADAPDTPLDAFDRAALARTTSAWVRALRFGADAAHMTSGEATRVYLAWVRWKGDARHCADLSATYQDTLRALVATEPDATTRAAIDLNGDHPVTLLDEAAQALFLQAWD